MRSFAVARQSLLFKTPPRTGAVSDVHRPVTSQVRTIKFVNQHVFDEKTHFLSAIFFISAYSNCMNLWRGPYFEPASSAGITLGISSCVSSIFLRWVSAGEALGDRGKTCYGAVMSKLLSPEVLFVGAALIALFVIGVLITIFNLAEPESEEASDTGDTAAIFVQPHPAVALAESRVLI